MKLSVMVVQCFKVTGYKKKKQQQKTPIKIWQDFEKPTRILDKTFGTKHNF